MTALRLWAITALFSAPVAAADRINMIIVDKSDQTLDAIYASGKTLQLTRVRFGAGWQDGPKQRRGDKRTPEGRYTIDEVRTRGGFKFLPALHISYPSAADRKQAARQGVDPGDAILIHGPPRGVPFNPPYNWTDGCIAVSAREIQLLARDTRPGATVVIKP